VLPGVSSRKFCLHGVNDLEFHISVPNNCRHCWLPVELGAREEFGAAAGEGEGRGGGRRKRTS